MSHNIIVPFGCSGGPGARPRTRRRRTAGLVAALATGLMLTAAPATQADTVTTTVDVGAYPTGVAITPDGTRAYVTNLFDNTVSVIDTTTNTVTDTIDLGRHRAYEVAITPDGTRAYVTNHGEYGKVSVIDTATNTVTDTVDVGDSPYGVAITPDGTRAYVANEGDDSVSVIDTATNAVTTTIDVDAGLFGPKGMAITPDGTRAYVANGAYAVSVIDTATNTVIGEPISVGSYPRDVAITPDGTRAYVTDNSVEYGGVYVIDTATNTVIDTIKVDEQLYGVAITPDGTRAYAANWGDNDAVFVIDTATNTFTTIDLDATAYALAFTPDGTRAYITNWGDKGTVLVIDRTPALTGTPPAGTVGQLYEYAFTVTGEPDPEVTVTAGTLPDGLTLGADGVLAGTPTAGERFEFAITASNGIGQDSTLPVALDINNVSALTGTPPAGTVGQPYEYAFTITGYPAPDVTVTAGTLPDGLTLGADGVLSGTPTGTGQFAFTITARNGIGDDATLPVVLEITESPALTGAPPAGTVGQPYHHSFTLTGYPAPDVTVTAGALPDGLTLSGQGVLSGTPTSAGMYSFTVTASNGFGENAVLEATLDVGQAPAITGTPPDGVVGQPYEHTFTVTGTPAPTVTVTDGALPDGLRLSEQGVLSGTPTTTGPHAFTVTASNGFGENAVREATLEVGQPPAITGTPPDGVVGQPYEHTFTVTGTPAPTVTVTDGAVPYGLTLSEQGVLSGTPPIAATYNFTVTVSNGFGDDAVLPVVVDIAETPSTMSSGSLESSGS